MELLKEPSETFKSIARKCSVSESTVIRVFDKHCHIPRLKLPKELCIVDVYPSRRMDYLRYALKDIPKSERNNVKYICMDMYQPYKLIAKKYFKKLSFVLIPSTLSKT